MNRHAWRVLVCLLLGVAPVSGQERQLIDRGVEINRDILRLGTTVELELEGSTADAFEMTFRVDCTADCNYIWPPTPGSAGTQLQTDGVAGATVLSWASAASSRANKNLEGQMDPQEALQALLSANVYRFHYKPDAAMSTQDFTTQYVGPVAEEAPWLMHHNGQVLNPINAFGYTAAAIQAMQAEIDALKAQLTERRRRTWRTLWLWRE